jgi:hypothetical protein
MRSERYPRSRGFLFLSWDVVDVILAQVPSHPSWLRTNSLVKILGFPQQTVVDHVIRINNLEYTPLGVNLSQPQCLPYTQVFAADKAC